MYLPYISIVTSYKIGQNLLIISSVQANTHFKIKQKILLYLNIIISE